MPIASAGTEYATSTVRDSPGAKSPIAQPAASPPGPHPDPDTTPCVSCPLGNTSVSSTARAVLGPALVTVTVYTRPGTTLSPAVTAVVPSSTVTLTSADTCTSVLFAPTLLPGAESGSKLDTVAVVVAAARAAAPASTVNLVRTSTGTVPSPRTPRSHTTSCGGPPLTTHVAPPGTGPPPLNSAVGVPTTVNPAGIVCRSSTPLAGAPPTFSTVVLYSYTTPSPAVIGPAGTRTSVTAMSTTAVPVGSTVVASVATLLAVLSSPVVVVARAVVFAGCAAAAAFASVVAVTVYVTLAPGASVPSAHGNAVGIVPVHAPPAVAPAANTAVSSSSTVVDTCRASTTPRFSTVTVNTTVPPSSSTGS